MDSALLENATLAQITGENMDLARGVVVIGEGRDSADNLALAATAAGNLLSLGILVDPVALSGGSKTQIVSLVARARKFVGADRDWTPMYPNFPAQVVEASEVELIVGAIVHYLSVAVGIEGGLVPATETLPREVLGLDVDSLTVYPVVSRDAFVVGVALDALGQTGGLAEGERERVSGLLYARSDLLDADVIRGLPNGENRVTAALAAYPDSITDALGVVRNADDGLRVVLARAATGVDPYTLDGKITFTGSLPRSARRALARLLAATARRRVDLDAVYRNRGLWQRIGRYAHLFDYARDDVALTLVLDVIHENFAYKTIAAEYEHLMDTGQAAAAARLLATESPGLLLRQARSTLLRAGKDDAGAVVRALSDAADKASTATLLSMLGGVRDTSTTVVTRAEGRNVTRERSSGDVVPGWALADLERQVSTVVAGRLGDGEFYSGLEGRVYVDPVLDGVVVPLIVRDAAEGSTLPRGTVLPMGDGDTIRLFTHWYNLDSGRTVDMDLSVVGLDESERRVGYVNWTGLRSGWATHSGDIISAPRPKGAAEFIDVNLGRARRAGIRYLVMDLADYNGSDLSEIDSLSGYMMIDGDAQVGEVFEPRRVASAFRSTAQSVNSVPLVVDLDEGTVTWLDASGGASDLGSAVHDSSSRESLVGAEVSRARAAVSVGELIRWVLGDRVTEDRDEADTMVGIDSIPLADTAALNRALLG